MAELAFELEYDGPALAAHEMDVRELAPALLSTADLVQELNRIVNPADPNVSVNVKATSDGSFLVWLSIYHDALVETLTSRQTQALAGLTGLLTTVGVLIGYL